MSTRSSISRTVFMSSPLLNGPGGSFGDAARSRVFRCVRELGEVVADVAEDVLDLAAKEDHRDDHGDGNDGDDECVLDQALAFVVAQECKHFGPPFLSIWVSACPLGGGSTTRKVVPPPFGLALILPRGRKGVTILATSAMAPTQAVAVG